MAKTVELKERDTGETMYPITSLDAVKMDNDNNLSILTQGQNGEVLTSVNGLPQWLSIDLIDILSYGVEWKPDVGDPELTRVGNMSYHKTLPIQSGMKGCIYNPVEKRLVYWLNENDWRFRKVPKTLNVNQVITPDESESSTEYYGLIVPTTKNLGEGQYIRSGDNIAKIIEVNDETSTIYVEWEQDTPDELSSIEIGSRVDGYDGEVMVYVPEFWIKSWDEPDRRCVRIAVSRIDNTWEHQPAIFLAAYRDTVLNIVPENMGYLSTLEVNSAISVANNKPYCRGGDNNPANDADEDIFKRQLGKCRTYLVRDNFRTYARKAGKEIMSYRQYKNIMYWLYVIEYANFNSQATYNAALTTEGFHQGGLGNGITGIVGLSAYNNSFPISPNGYTNELGNGTGIKLIAPLGPNPVGSVYSIRWRGLENPFGDVSHIVDGIIVDIKKDSTRNKVYTTDKAYLFTDFNYQAMDEVGEEYSGEYYIKEWDLGNTAEIIPRMSGGSATTYKCDSCVSHNNSSGLRKVYFGGSAISGAECGVGSYSSNSSMVNISHSSGIRTSCIAQ